MAENQPAYGSLSTTLYHTLFSWTIAIVTVTRLHQNAQRKGSQHAGTKTFSDLTKEFSEAPHHVCCSPFPSKNLVEKNTNTELPHGFFDSRKRFEYRHAELDTMQV
jgi:hypothetical protein